MSRWTARLREPVDALPLDLFRIAVGLLALGWLLNQIALAGAFTVPDGLIDHELIRDIFPYTRVGFFLPGMTARFFYVALGAGCLLAAGIIAGWRARLCSFFLFLIATSLARWNFPLMQIDDTTIVVCLAWLMMLPVGRTLTLEGLARRGPAVWNDWLDARVPGLAARCLMANVCVVYLVAGALKLGSPYWRSGFALYATLRLPIAYFPDAWGPAAVPLLRVLCWTALAVELSLPFLLLCPRESRLKRAGLALQLGFHGAIASALALPVANLAHMATALLFFGAELTGALRRRVRRAAPKPAPGTPGLGERLAPVFLVVLTISTMRWFPGWSTASSRATNALWMIGVYEDYSLFDWIDKKNVRGEPELTWLPAGGPPRRVDAGSILPASMRSSLLMGYFFGDIVHGSLWIGVPYRRRPELRSSLLARMAARFCRERPLTGPVRVCANVRRISPENADLSLKTRKLLMDFDCAGGGAPRVRAYVGEQFLPPCPDPAWKGPYVPVSAVYPPET